MIFREVLGSRFTPVELFFVKNQATTRFFPLSPLAGLPPEHVHFCCVLRRRGDIIEGVLFALPLHLVKKGFFLHLRVLGQ